MNLIDDPWLPGLTCDGRRITIRFSQISDPNITELDLPRLDFQGAAYQLLIGLLQTTFAPKDIDDWLDSYEAPPSADELQVAFDTVRHAFFVDDDSEGSGARFMQDLSSLGHVKSSNSIANLLIEAPGDNALKYNKDFFIKRGLVNQLSLPMAALALFTLQINAPSGGQGHRTGLRGGGPMTTLIRPSHDDSTLWQKLWLNVINRADFEYPDPNLHDGSVFPWLTDTRVSDKSGEPIYAQDVHPLHVYWAMPRRIRLIIDDASVDTKVPIKPIDDLTGAYCDQIVSHYRTQNYGHNYEGDWSPHPITPYRFNPKKPEETPFSIKAQPGGINYKLWHMLTFTGTQKDSGFIRAKVINQANEIYEASEGLIDASRLWAFSYDMDNMKARGFYSKELPIYHIRPEDQEQLLNTVLELHTLTDSIVRQLRESIKKGWLSERQAKDTKGDMSNIDAMFWQRSETLFFAAIDEATRYGGKLTRDAGTRWLNRISKLTEQIFEEQVLSSAVIKQRHMEQLNQLRAFLYGNKALADFRGRHKVTNKENV